MAASLLVPSTRIARHAARPSISGSMTSRRIRSNRLGRALAQARSSRFDLILLDVMLPEMDGLAACRAIRVDGTNKDAAILMLSARETTSGKIWLESGADDYMAKPFGVRE